MIPFYAAVLGLRIYRTDVEAQKIDRSMLAIYGMVLDTYQLEDKYKKTRFFQETCLVDDTVIERVLEMPFLALTKIEINFAERKLN